MITFSGPSGIGYIDWRPFSTKIVANIVASTSSSSIGPSPQKSGDFGEAAAMSDQTVGKVGPMIGKWDPETGNRMIQEF